MSQDAQDGRLTDAEELPGPVKNELLEVIFAKQQPLEVYDPAIHVTRDDLARLLNIGPDAAESRLVAEQQAGVAVRVRVVLPTGARRMAWKKVK